MSVRKALDALDGTASTAVATGAAAGNGNPGT